MNIEIWIKTGFDRERELGDPQRLIVHADDNEAYHGPACRMEDSACGKNGSLQGVYSLDVRKMFLRTVTSQAVAWKSQKELAS